MLLATYFVTSLKQEVSGRALGVLLMSSGRKNGFVGGQHTLLYCKSIRAKFPVVRPP